MGIQNIRNSFSFWALAVDESFICGVIFCFQALSLSHLSVCNTNKEDQNYQDVVLYHIVPLNSSIIILFSLYFIGWQLKIIVQHNHIKIKNALKSVTWDNIFLHHHQTVKQWINHFVEELNLELVVLMTYPLHCFLAHLCMETFDSLC